MGEDSTSIHALLRRWSPMGSWWGGEGGSRRVQIPRAWIYIQIWQHGAAAPTLTHQETGPAKSVSKQHHIGTAPVRCTAKFYRRPGKCTPAPCPGGSEAARQPGPWPGASPFIPPSTVTARFSVALFTRNRRQSLSSIVRKGLSILDKLCLYPKILELASGISAVTLSPMVYVRESPRSGSGAH